ncbi:hypothetical protein DPM13_09535 [Paracoccus mutanolyticus]|uniref:Uncharacterized protein n=1 Tax=Paracoccus mutanolyticus TaxID=1499308 RepID=A0ABM6WRQ4_9RHOB|nr:hypothetical protein DPM13_09535 [Paracoccus mutanolyticus]
MLFGVAARIVQHLREESAVSGFWDNQVSQEEARRWIFQHLDNCSIFDFGDLDAILPIAGRVRVRARI